MVYTAGKELDVAYSKERVGYSVQLGKSWMWCTAREEEDSVYCGKELDVVYCRGRGRCCVLWERVGCGVLPGKRKMLCTVGKSWMWSTAGEEEDAVYCGKELDVVYCRGRGRCCVLWERVGCGVLAGKRKMLCTAGKK